MEQALWFSREEYLQRLSRVQAALPEHGCDMLLVFHPESVTYLTGFFTTGYLSFQCVIIPVTGEPTVIFRDLEEFYFERTSVVSKRVLWSDGDDTTALTTETIIRLGGAAARIGIEKTAWVLNAQRYDALTTRLPRATFVDASKLVLWLRRIKSPAETSYQRRAARVAESGMAAGVAAIKPGATERDVAAAISGTMIRAGSDLAHPGPVASGERALHIHGGFSDRTLELGDTVHLEVVPSVRRYHARFMRAIKVGRATVEERALARRLIDIQDRAIEAVSPGVPAIVPDQLYREGILSTGLVGTYTNKTFYSVGLMLDPTAESMEAHPRSEWHFEAGMTFHTYLILKGLCFSETILVTEHGCERLTKYPRELIVA